MQNIYIFHLSHIKFNVKCPLYLFRVGNNYLCFHSCFNFCNTDFPYLWRGHAHTYVCEKATTLMFNYGYKSVLRARQNTYERLKIKIIYQVKKWYKLSYLQNRNILTVLENEFLVTRGEGCGGGSDWEFVMNMYILLYAK